MLYKYYQQHIFPHVLNQVMQVPSLMDKRRELLLPIQGEVLEIGFGSSKVIAHALGVIGLASNWVCTIDIIWVNLTCHECSLYNYTLLIFIVF